MAWYALYKWFSCWRKTKYINMNYYYSEYVLKSKEQRIREKEERRKKAYQTFQSLYLLKEMIHYESCN